MIDVRKFNFGPLWWAAYYNQQITHICELNVIQHKMGTFSEEKLQQSNEEIYKNIMARNTMLNLAARQMEETDIW